MPLVLTPTELRPRMRLARPLTTGGKLLLPVGAVLSDGDIQLLQESYPSIQAAVADEDLDGMGLFDDDAHDRTVAHQTRHQLQNIFAGVRQKYAARMSLRDSDFRGVEEAIAGIAEYLRENPVAAAILTRHTRPGHFLTDHAANVFYLSLVLGNAVCSYVNTARAALGGYSTASVPALDLVPLGLAALFQDLSLWPMADLFQKSRRLTELERAGIREHPVASAEMLPDDTPLATVQAVKTHHENCDGSGYPYGLEPWEAPIFARILRIADAYDTVTATDVFGQAVSPARALWDMTRGPSARFYDPVLLKVFTHLMQPFPIGAKVKLSCGRYGVVVRYGTTHPCLPTIIVAFDAQGERLPRAALEGPFSLDQVSDLHIVAFRGEDLSDLYDRTEQEPEPLVLMEFATLFEALYP